jgi:Uma2 family endonuclease
MGTAALMTVEQFSLMRTSDTEDYELVEGELVPLSSGTPLHAMIRDLAGDLLRSYFRRNRVGAALAEVDCRLDDDTVRRPDISVFLGARAGQFDINRIPVPFAPDIALEVLSASETAIDVNRKVLDYLRAGCREVWLLDHPNGEIFVQTDAAIRLLRGQDPLESPLLPGFSHPVADFLLSPLPFKQES